jgi:hypothetical protein
MNDPLISFCFATADRPGALFNSLLALKNEIVSLPSIYDEIMFEIIINDSSNSSCVPPVECLSHLFNDKHIIFNYFISPRNGVDAAYELLANYSKGAYLWLMSDDDQIITTMLSTIISKLLHYSPTVFVVNSLLSSYNLSINYDSTLFAVDSCFATPSVFTHNNMSTLYQAIKHAPSFISFALVSREHWNSNHDYSTLGTELSHVTRIFGNVNHSFTCLVDCQPYLRLRMNNNQWNERAILIWFINWPYVLSKCAGIQRSTIRDLSYDGSFFALIAKALYFRSCDLLKPSLSSSNRWGRLSPSTAMTLRIVRLLMPRLLAFFIVALRAFNRKPWVVIDSCR